MKGDQVRKEGSVQEKARSGEEGGGHWRKEGVR